MTQRFFGEYQDAFEAISGHEPGVSFRSGFDRVDSLLENRLRLGEIVEICGERNTAKLYLCHAIMANALIGHSNCESFRFFIFDYAKKFDLSLLKRLVHQKSNLTPEEVDALLANVFVQNFVGNNQLHFVLRRLAEVTNEDRVWHCFKNNIAVTSTLIFIMDIGSLMHNTNLSGIDGQLLQDKIYGCLRKLANGGAFILMLNHAFYNKNVAFPLDASLGYNWRRLIKNRLFLMRDEKDPQLHVALARTRDGEKRCVKFKLNVQQRVQRDGS